MDGANDARVPSHLWQHSGEAPRLQDVLSRVGGMLKDLGYEKSLAALEKEGKRKGVSLEAQGIKDGEPLLELWAKAYAATQRPTSDDSSESESSSEDAEVNGDSVSDSESDDSSSSSSSSDSESGSGSSTKHGQKRKRASSSSDSSSSDSSESESESSSSSSDSSEGEKPAKKAKLSKKGQSDSSESESSSDSSPSNSDKEEEVDSSSSARKPSSPSPAPKVNKIKSAKKSLASLTVPAPSRGKSGSATSSSATLDADADAEEGKNSNANNTSMHPDRVNRMVPPPSNAVAYNKQQASNGKKEHIPFSRIPTDQRVDPRFGSNKYNPYDYADRAYKDLSVTKGKGFTKEKNKKKRGSYRGGAIDLSAKGIKFED